ncbi:hypothetical protein A9P82_12550 [Arachidicoccus ginsenosidimutans]|uniref:Rieske (2Fe-2S) protein n=1 Tax=Arachidicoccus sp. BS20 TaxID=1850526 RepID=UPI0007F10FBB|nr:Rieske 2Fe-2S domain-containing protein [Arachidicoccus sp. BS20]ANI90039.1 hypothetical protein A9P82_12550 [Arachidicoccus sp. BS20]
MPFYKIAEAIDDIPFHENGMCVFSAGDKKITLAKINNQLYAFAELCPHASVPLVDGYVSPKGYVVCELHEYQFSLKHGRCLNVEDYKMKVYKTELREDGWYVEV